MIDREDGRPSHTMWVIKPIAPPAYEPEASDTGEEPIPSSDQRLSTRDTLEPTAPFPFAQPISTELILCRICESQIPQWYFEKHSETCVETHRLEAEISDCNESISELRNTIRDLLAGVERSSPVSVPEYRGMPIFSPSSSPSFSLPLQLFRAGKIQRMSVKRMQKRLLEQLDDILQVALEVSVPSLKDEEAKEPIERQRLLSPTSERKVSQVRNWCKPNAEDPALGQLVQDAERVMRQKVDNVVRMQNTIRYSEKIWHEWEEKVAAVLEAESDSDEEDEQENKSDGEEIVSTNEDGDHSSTTSEYAFNGDAPSSEPTPMASSSAVPYQVYRRPDRSSSMLSPTPTPAPAPALIPAPGPAPMHSPTPFAYPRQLHTRSSTPSSISSPLALAAPIVASSSSEDAPPPMDLGEPRRPMIQTRQTFVDAKSLLTPPLSPLVSPYDSRSNRRRHSTTSRPPAGAIPAGPLSPRQPSVAPISRTSPTSIKDFDIIKPISKGAFGSVFLAKKKVTGDYYAIKVLKKADMIAKNQITNVKAERMILMKQAESPFVTKLYFTFQSKENLYLVMEYLNGGDCAALIKSIGSLPEAWTQSYVAEVVLGLEYLHQRGVVHR